MGFGLISAGFLFLILPTVNLIDIMPDFIGYALIFAGLFRLRRLDSYLYKAARGALILTLINLSKPLLLLLAVSDSESAQSSNIMTFTTVYLIIELIVGIPFFKNLFEGFTSLGYKYTTDTPGKRKKKLLGTFTNIKKAPLSYEHSVKNPQSAERKRIGSFSAVRYAAFPKRWAIYNGVDWAYRASLIFCVLRSVFTLLPELSVLATSETIDSFRPGILFSSVGMRIALISLCVFMGLILSAVWYSSAGRYISRIRKDGKFIQRLSDAYETKILSDKQLMLSLDYATDMALALTGLLCGADLFFDTLNIIPNIISAVFLGAAVLRFSRFLPKMRVIAVPAYAAALICTAASAACAIYTKLVYYVESGLEPPFTLELYSVLFPVSKALLIILTVMLTFGVFAFIKSSGLRLRREVRSGLTVGCCGICLFSLTSAIGYFTDVTGDLIRIPIHFASVGFTWEINIYISFFSFVLYIISFIVCSGAFETLKKQTRSEI